MTAQAKATCFTNSGAKTQNAPELLQNPSSISLDTGISKIRCVRGCTSCSLLLLVCQCWQSSCCNALTDSLEVIISSVELHLWEVRELSFQHLCGSLQHQVTSLALADTTQDHDMIDLVVLTVLSKTVAQVDTACPVEVAGLVRVALHCLLHQLEALGVVLVLDGAHVWMRELVVLRDISDLVCVLGGTTLAEVKV